jgi:hypothetical protein
MTMRKIILIFMAGLLLISNTVFAQDDVSIDSNGNVKTGVTNTSGNLEVTGASGEHGIVGSTNGTGAAGVYGINTTNNNYGILGYEQYGVYGNSATGDAGFFQGNAHVTGNLTLDGSLIGPLIGDITGVTAGTGLSGGGTSGDVTLNANTTYLQRRVTGTCAAGSSIRVISATGTVTCETDDVGTYSAGTGLNLSGTAFNVNVPLSLNGSTVGDGILSGTNSATNGAYGVLGLASATGAFINIGGVFQANGNSGAGVYGIATASGTADNYGGYFEADGNSGTGVYSSAMGNSGVGVYGVAFAIGTADNYGGHFQANGDSGRGVYGYAPATGAVTNYGGYFEAHGDSGRGVYGFADGSSGRGVYGLADGSSGRGVYGEHTSGNYGYIGGNVDAIFGSSNSATGSGIYAQNFNTGYAAYFAGKVHVAGTFTATNKQFTQPHASDPSKEIVYIAAEAPEAVIFHRGTGELKSGVAEIDLPEYFSVVASERGLQVQITPLEDCNGIFVESKDRLKFKVKELMGGKHNARFDYLITAVRAGFEEHRPIVENTHYKPRENETAEDFESRFRGDDLSTRAMRRMLIANGILSKDGKLNMATVKNLGWTVAGAEREADGKRIAGIESNTLMSLHRQER